MIEHSKQGIASAAGTIAPEHLADSCIYGPDCKAGPNCTIHPRRGRTERRAYDHAKFCMELDGVLTELGTMLKAKNRSYGDSALNPIRVFSKSSPGEQLMVRIDDKLSRLLQGEEAGEDVLKDLLGYLILYRIWHNREELRLRTEVVAGGSEQ